MAWSHSFHSSKVLNDSLAKMSLNPCRYSGISVSTLAYFCEASASLCEVVALAQMHSPPASVSSGLRKTTLESKAEQNSDSEVEQNSNSKVEWSGVWNWEQRWNWKLSQNQKWSLLLTLLLKGVGECHSNMSV